MRKLILMTVKCPECGQANMRTTGAVIHMNPPAFEHECPKCGFVAFYDNAYPRTGYEGYEVRRLDVE